MDIEFIKIVGQIAGIGGLSLGIFLLLFRDIIRKKIFPNLKKNHAYLLLRLISILIFLITFSGISAWVFINYTKNKHSPVNLNQITQKGTNIGNIQTGGKVIINVEENGVIPPPPSKNINFDPVIVAKKVLTGKKIAEAKKIDFNGNKKQEEIAVVTDEKNNGFNLYLLRPALGSYVIAFSQNIFTHIDPELFIVKCEDGFEKILISGYPYGCASCVSLDYFYFYQKNGSIKTEEFSIGYETDYFYKARSIALPTSMQGNNFEKELKCIQNSLIRNKRLQPDFSTYNNLGYVEKWIDLNGRKLEDGQILKLVYIDPRKINFDDLNRDDSWMLDFLDVKTKIDFFRKKLELFMQPGKDLAACESNNIVKNKFYSFIHHFKSGVVGYSQEDNKFFILYYPVAGWFHSVCIDKKNVYIDDLIFLPDSKKNIDKKKNEFGFLKINMKTMKISVIDGDYTEFIKSIGLSN